MPAQWVAAQHSCQAAGQSSERNQDAQSVKPNQWRSIMMKSARRTGIDDASSGKQSGCSAQGKSQQRAHRRAALHWSMVHPPSPPAKQQDRNEDIESDG